MADTESKKRIEYLDFLKVIGLIGIMIAHVDSPKWALMARAFDVPLMVLIASMLGRKSYEKGVARGEKASSYLISRVLRLAVPTWIFLVFFFLVYAVFSHSFFEPIYYVKSFLFSLYGISYVWVILIYIYSAVCMPLFHKVGTGKIVCVALIWIYALYEILWYLEFLTDNKVFVNTFYYIIPYGALSFIGFCYPAMKEKTKKTVAIVFATIFFAFIMIVKAITGEFDTVGIATFPPRLYYLSYGIFVSFVLFLIFERFDLKIYKSKPVAFVSKNSLWIYLWHIFCLEVYNRTPLFNFWYVELVAVFVTSALITFVQCKLVEAVRRKRDFKFLKYLA